MKTQNLYSCFGGLRWLIGLDELLDFLGVPEVPSMGVFVGDLIGDLLRRRC